MFAHGEAQRSGFWTWGNCFQTEWKRSVSRVPLHGPGLLSTGADLALPTPGHWPERGFFWGTGLRQVALQGANSLLSNDLVLMSSLPGNDFVCEVLASAASQTLGSLA